MCASSVLDAKGIARQYWWAWIETSWHAVCTYTTRGHRPPVLVGVD